MKRYDIWPDHGDCNCSPDESPDGEWVRYESVAAVVAERDRLREAGDAMAAHMEAVPPEWGGVTGLVAAWRAASEGDGA